MSNTATSQAPAPDQATSLRQGLKALNIQRQSLEQESGAILAELTAVDPTKPTVPPMGVDTPLTDPEGYPRNDIDVYRARTLRGRLAEIQTDHKKLMQEIERNLHQLALVQNANRATEEAQEAQARMQTKPKPKFDPVSQKWVVCNWDGTIAGAGPASQGRAFDSLAEADAAASVVPTNTTTGVSNLSIQDDDSTIHRAAPHTNDPFCRVDSVAPNSPAAAAGLRVDDLVVALGPLTTLDGVSDLVRRAAADNAAIELRVQRRQGVGGGDDETNAVTTLPLLLKPRPWSGRGLLGCHIVPV